MRPRPSPLGLKSSLIASNMVENSKYCRSNLILVTERDSGMILPFSNLSWIANRDLAPKSWKKSEKVWVYRSFKRIRQECISVIYWLHTLIFFYLYSIFLISLFSFYILSEYAIGCKDDTLGRIHLKFQQTTLRNCT